MERRRTPRLWEVLREHPNLLDLDLGWRAQLGEDYDLCRSLLVLTKGRAERWPCGEAGRLGCSRRIVEHGPGDFVAVCGDPERRCSTISITRSERVLHRLDWQELARRLGTQLGVDVEDVSLVGGHGGAGWRRGDFVRLGVAPFGRSPVVCYLARAGTSEDFSRFLLRARRREGDDARVLLFLSVATGFSVAVRDTCVELGILLLGLDDITYWTPERSIRLDLGEYVLEQKLGVRDPAAWLWPRFDLILDPQGGRYWYRGQRLAFKKSAALPALLLERMAEGAGGFVSRKDLAVYMWPDEYFSEEGRFVNWDRRVRGHKDTLDGQLDCNSEEAVLEAVPSGSEIEGGYRLRLHQEAIAWWSRRDDGRS